MTNKDYKNKPFEVICTNCALRTSRKGIAYDGVVNHHYTILSPNELNIEYKCFTCESEWTQVVSFFKEGVMGKPQSANELLKRERVKERAKN